MDKQEKQIPELINDSDYLKTFFHQRIKDIDSHGIEILQVISHPIKQHFDDIFFHYVIQHDITIRESRGMRRRYKVFSATFSNHGRKKMYQVLELAYQHGFNQGQMVVPQPLWYIDKLMTAFYIGIPGENLLEHIKNGYPVNDSIKKIAQGLYKFHNIQAPKKINLLQHDFTSHYLDPTDVSSRDYNKNTATSKDVIKHFELLKKIKKNLISEKENKLSHGDFHPENVIINKFNNQQVAIIDFSESCFAPIHYDIASFLQQLQFMTQSYLTLDEFQELENIFFSAYFQGKTITTEDINKINLYKAWTSLKSTIYFMIFEDEINKKFAKHLLKKSQEFANKIKY